MSALQSGEPMMTLEKYETFSEDRRIEVFDGTIYDMSSSSQEHQTNC